MPAIREKDGLTFGEGEVMDALVAAVNAFAKLERQHPDEGRDFCDGIHRCQDVLAVRIARREYPEGWPTYNDAESGENETEQALVELYEAAVQVLGSPSPTEQRNDRKRLSLLLDKYESFVHALSGERHD